MSIVEQIRKNLVDPDRHGPMLEALVSILEEHGEKGAKDRIKGWIEEIEAESVPLSEDEE